MLGQIVEELAKQAEIALGSYDVDWHIRVYTTPAPLVKLVVYVPGVDGGRGRLVDGGVAHPMRDYPEHAKFAAEKLVRQIKELLKQEAT